MGLFNLVSPYGPAGDQPKAIDYLVRGVEADEKYQVLLGVTGSGKTFSMANIINRVEKPSLIIAPNKTLAAQLYNEFKMLFPDNCVEYFVSYYDYYQPEAYIPSSDTYIQKDSSINELIDKMRHSATRSVLARKDVIVVASVSCIYGLGAPEEYLDLRVTLDRDMEISREEVIRKLWISSTPAMMWIFTGVPSGSGETGWRFFQPTKKIKPCALISLVTPLKRSVKLML